MPGLSFLAKKSWHTTNLDNVERVWLAEQKDAKEKKKLGELQKQLQEERQMQELRQLQVESGHKVKTVDTSLDWMYQGPSSELQKQQSSEEYLLGKIFKPKNEPTQDFKKEDVPEAKWLGKVSSKNDSFTRVHEDPILFIKQEEQRKRNSVINNPMKMDRIRQQIAAELEEAESEKRAKKDKKKAKKDAKKDAKRKKKDDGRKRDRSRSRSSSSSDSEPDSRHAVAPLHSNGHRDGRRRSRSRSGDHRQYPHPQSSLQNTTRECSNDRHTDNNRRVDDRNNRNDRQLDHGSDRRTADRRDVNRRDDSRDRQYYRDNRDNRDTRHSDDRYDRGRDSRANDDRRPVVATTNTDDIKDRRSSERPRRERSPSLSPPRNSRSDAYSQDVRDSRPLQPQNRVTEHEEMRPKRVRSPSRSDHSSDSDASHRARVKKASQRGYGLITSSNRAAPTASSVDKGYLGPNPNLLKQKSDKEKQEQDLRNNRKRENVSAISAEERDRRVAAMQQDAEGHDSSRLIRMDAFARNEIQDSANSGKAEFIESMRKEVYVASAETGIKGRLDQNKHYTQRGSELESGGYKKN